MFGPAAPMDSLPRKDYHMRCIECGAQLITVDEPMDVEFREESLTVRGVEHYKCPECGEIVFNSKMNKEYNRTVDREYRRRCGLLSPEEIKKFRKSLHLTQEQFQALLGVGKLSACRWETGRLAQSRTVDNLIRAYMSCPHLAQEALERAELVVLGRRKQAMAPSPLEKVCEYLGGFAQDEEASSPIAPSIREWLSFNSEGASLIEGIREPRSAKIDDFVPIAEVCA